MSKVRDYILEMEESDGNKLDLILDKFSDDYLEEDFTTYDLKKPTHIQLDANGNFRVAGKIYNYNDPVWRAIPYPHDGQPPEKPAKKEEKYEDHCKHVWVKTELIFKTVEDCKYCGIKKEDLEKKK